MPDEELEYEPDRMATFAEGIEFARSVLPENDED